MNRGIAPPSSYGPWRSIALTPYSLTFAGNYAGKNAPAQIGREIVHRLIAMQLERAASTRA